MTILNLKLNLMLLLATVFLNSCDTRKDFNAGLNSPPQLLIRSDDANFNPTSAYQQVINDSLKLSQGNYPFDYNLQTNEVLGTIPVSVNIIGNGIFQNLASTPAMGYIFRPGTVGFQSINLKAIDAYGLSTTASLNLTTFKDLPPIALLTYLNTAVLNPLQYKLDASASYDKDAKFGGTLINYQFNISPNYQVITPYSSISYIFPSAGNFQVSLRVEDNDSTWSPSYVIYINVP
jgi:hypothetical protein